MFGYHDNDAYEPGDPKGWDEGGEGFDYPEGGHDEDVSVADSDDRPPLSALGRVLFGIASSEAVMTDALLRQAGRDVADALEDEDY